MHFSDRGGADILEKGIKVLVKHNVIVVAPRRVQTSQAYLRGPTAIDLRMT